jgi:excisionase family DNA binding protein
MPKKSPPEGALFVRLPANAVEKLHRAAEVTGMRKKDIVANLVSTLSIRGDGHDASVPRGAYSFRPYDAPEVLNAEQAAQFLQIDEPVVLELAEGGKLPGRKLGAAWRFSRAALVEWLSKADESTRSKR